MLSLSLSRHASSGIEPLKDDIMSCSTKTRHLEDHSIRAHSNHGQNDVIRVKGAGNRGDLITADVLFGRGVRKEWCNKGACTT